MMTSDKSWRCQITVYHTETFGCRSHPKKSAKFQPAGIPS